MGTVCRALAALTLLVPGLARGQALPPPPPPQPGTITTNAPTEVVTEGPAVIQTHGPTVIQPGAQTVVQAPTQFRPIIGLHRMRYDYAGGPVPPNGTLRTWHPWWMFGVGLGAWFVGWSFDVSESRCADAIANCSASTAAIPIVGPWIALAGNNYSSGDGAMTAVGGVLQLIGVAGIIAGPAIARPYVEINEPVYGRSRRPAIEWAVVPANGGIGAAGRF